MRTTLLLVAILGGTAHADKVLDKAASTVTHDCGADPVVKVASSAMKITLTGACKQISITGSNNTLTVASGAAIDVMGSHNHMAIVAVDTLKVVGSFNEISYEKAVTEKQTPKVSVDGQKNKIGAKK